MLLPNNTTRNWGIAVVTRDDLIEPYRYNTTSLADIAPGPHAYLDVAKYDVVTDLQMAVKFKRMSPCDLSFN